MGSRTIAASLVALAALGAALATPAPAGAVSIGAYGLVGAGATDWWDDSPHHGGPPPDAAAPPGAYDGGWDTRHGGAGLVLDATSPFSMLSYRLSIGWERITYDRPPETGDLNLEGVVVDQDLNFQLFGSRTPTRLWVGPELRLGYLNGEVGGSEKDDFLAIGLGAVLGFDLDVSPSATLSWKLGYLFTAYSGGDHWSSFDDSSLDEGHAYFSMAILFTPGGRYRSQPPPPPGHPSPPQPAPYPGNPGRW